MCARRIFAVLAVSLCVRRIFAAPAVSSPHPPFFAASRAGAGGQCPPLHVEEGADGTRIPLKPPHPSLPAAMPPSPLWGEGRGRTSGARIRDVHPGWSMVGADVLIGPRPGVGAVPHKTGRRVGARSRKTGCRVGARPRKTGHRVGEHPRKRGHRIGARFWKTAHRLGARPWETGRWGHRPLLAAPAPFMV